MVFEIKLTPPKFPKKLRSERARGVVNDELRKGIRRATTVLLKEAVRSTDKASGRLREGWERKPVRTIRISGGSEIRSGVKNTRKKLGRFIARVYESGTKKHPFPPVTPGDPALGPWIRQNPRGVSFTINERGGVRPADLSNPSDVRRLAWVIGGGPRRGIRRRGLPRLRTDRKFFTKAIKRARKKIQAEITKARDGIVKRLG